jgi:DNA-binding ferritin-like protein
MKERIDLLTLATRLHGQLIVLSIFFSEHPGLEELEEEIKLFVEEIKERILNVDS